MVVGLTSSFGGVGVVPFTVLIVTVVRAPNASMSTHCSAARQVVFAPTLNVKRPGCEVEVGWTTWIGGFGQIAVYGVAPSNTSTSNVPKPQMVPLGPVRVTVGGMTVSAPVAGRPLMLSDSSKL